MIIESSRRIMIAFLILLAVGVPELSAKQKTDTAALKAMYNSTKSIAERRYATEILGLYFQDNQKYSTAIDWVKKGIPLALETKNDSLIFRQYNLISAIQDEAGDMEDAIETLQQYVITQKAGNKKEGAMAYNNIGVMYGKISDYTRQTGYYIKAQKIHENLGHKKDALEVETNLAIVYLGQNNYQKAINTLKPLIPYFKNINDYRMVENIYGNLCSAYGGLKQYDSATLYSDLQIEIVKITKEPDRLFKAWARRGALCSRTGNMAGFKQANDSMLYYAQESGNIDDESLTYSNLGMYYAYIPGKMLLSRSYFEKALALSYKLGDKSFIVSNLNNLAATYYDLKEYQKAYKFQEHAYQLLKDSVITNAGQEKVAEMQTRFQTEKKEAKIKLLDEKSKLQQRTSYFLIIGLGLFGVLCFSLIRNNRIKQKTNKKLAQLNGALEEANQTKAKLFGIISHDLRSPISQVYQFLKLQQLDPDRLDEAQRIKLNNKIQMATGSLLETMEDLLLWSKTQMNQFKPVLQPVELKDLMNECSQLLQLNIDAKNLHLKNLIASNTVQNTDPNFLQTIVRNLLQNAIKVSPNNEDILIDYKENSLTISNKGGYFSNTDYKQIIGSRENENSLSGLGLKVVDELSRQLNIEVQYLETDMDTTIVMLRFN